jgi:hypothetical protein
MTPSQIDQGFGSISIGAGAGSVNQGTGAVSIGFYAGTLNQGFASIAIGAGAGDFNQADHSICMMANYNNFFAGTGGFYVDPISLHSDDPAINSDSGPSYFGGYTGFTGVYNLSYNMSTCEVFANSNKTFVIDHPCDKNKYLVHACVESPSANLFYNGVDSIPVGQKYVNIILPNYVDKIGTNFTVSLTSMGPKTNLWTTGVENGQFTVNGESESKFFWHVYGLMGNIDSEPLKDKVSVKGNGPYRWI